jgi:hypothetical protein
MRIFYRALEEVQPPERLFLKMYGLPLEQEPLGEGDARLKKSLRGRESEGRPPLMLGRKPTRCAVKVVCASIRGCFFRVRTVDKA